MSEGSSKAFVAGATGLTGGAVVRHLCARGLATVAHVRPDSSRLAEQRAALEALGAEVDTTAWDEEAMTESLRRIAPTVVFALLGTTRKRAKHAAAEGRDPSAESYEAVDYGLSALLRRAAEACGTRPRFVYLSSMGVSPSTRNPYMHARARIERELREGALPFTVVRPSFISGDRDESRPGESIGATLSDSALGLLGALGGRRTRDRYRSITGDALGRDLVELALDPKAENRVVEADELAR